MKELKYANQKRDTISQNLQSQILAMLQTMTFPVKEVSNISPFQFAFLIPDLGLRFKVIDKMIDLGFNLNVSFKPGETTYWQKINGGKNYNFPFAYAINGYVEHRQLAKKILQNPSFDCNTLREYTTGDYRGNFAPLHILIDSFRDYIIKGELNSETKATEITRDFVSMINILADRGCNMNQKDSRGDTGLCVSFYIHNFHERLTIK
jgi:hypothetical protein